MHFVLSFMLASMTHIITLFVLQHCVAKSMIFSEESLSYHLYKRVNGIRCHKEYELSISFSRKKKQYGIARKYDTHFKSC